MSRSGIEYIDVPIKIDGKLKLVKGISKYTTCSDVIKMVLKKANISKANGSPEAFGIYESSRGIERLVPAKSRLLKVIKSWEKHDDYEFVFRKVNTAFAVTQMSEARRRKLTNQNRMFKVASISDTNKSQQCKYKHSNVKDAANESIDPNCTVYTNTRRADIDRNVTGQSDDHEFVRCGNTCVSMTVNDVKYAVRKPLKEKSSNVSGLGKDVTEGHKIHSTPKSNVAKEMSTKIKRHETLACDIANQVVSMKSRDGKDALLQKYFADYITYRSPGDKSRDSRFREHKYRDSRFRERGDGAESSTAVLPGRQGDGSECTFSTPKARTSMIPPLFRDSEDSGQDEEFDVAFISDIPHVDGFSCSTPHVRPARGSNWINANCDVMDVDNNIACVRKLVDYSLSEDSILTDPSDISDISYVYDNIVHNINSVSNIVKTIFKEDRQLSEDDEMESFMKTKLYDDLSDEGLSSLGSYDEIEIIV